MCDGKHECQRPKELIDKPEKCSPEQIKKCHGDEEEHPCKEEASDESTSMLSSCPFWNFSKWTATVFASTI